jgi:hypothetical protein
MHPSDLIIPAAILGNVISLCVLGYAWIQYKTRRAELDSHHRPTSDQIDARLARLESAVDTIAVEIERVSEAQRFTTRILAERSSGMAPSSPPKVITPH